MAQVNPVVRFIQLNANNGQMITIRCTIVCGYMEIEEDSAANAGTGQGVEGNLLDPFTGAPNPGAGVEVWLPSSAANPRGDYPIAIGDPRHNHGAQFLPIGNGGSGTYVDSRSQVPQNLPAGPGYQNQSLGTPIIQLRSHTATPTVVRVKEWA